ncbi:MAG: M20/M25/M40 family metallo-hydrolase [Candidatus Moranbacteria bacterium]|nr:M20/M25/M40 family metallo-hydrolase [Candidatus Moranbacteria bacterium]
MNNTEKIKKLLTKFVSIPSFVDSNNNEEKITLEIAKFFKVNFSEYKKISIQVEANRHNLLFIPKSPKIIFCCHLDTVQPSQKNQLEVKFENDKAYGLGTKDMKGGWVSSLLATKKLTQKDREKVGFLFYCDEEYEQKGMKVMAKNHKQIPASVECLVSPESRFNLAYGSRGYALIEIEITGKKAHTARPFQGTNAGEKMYELYEKLSKSIEKKNNLGETTITLVGATIGSLDESKGIVSQFNSVPDYAKGIFSLRISDTKLTEELLKNKIEKTIKNLNVPGYLLKIKEFQSPGLIASQKLLNKFTRSAKEAGYSIDLADPALAGYNDVLMLSAQTGIPLIGFGPYGENNHSLNEYVSVQSIEDTANIFERFIVNF